MKTKTNKREQIRKLKQENIKHRKTQQQQQQQPTAHTTNAIIRTNNKSTTIKHNFTIRTHIITS